MSLKILHNPRCSKSRATLQLLLDRGLQPEIVLYLETPPGAEELKSILRKLDFGPRQLMRSGEPEYRALGLDDENRSDQELIEAMVATPRLIERPIVLHDGKAALGRPPEAVLDIL
jgi:arsenate reductase